MMFSQEQMEEWEARAVPLDECGESEAYFPLWGIVDVDDYLQKSDASRAERQRVAALEGAGAKDEVGASDARVEDAVGVAAGAKVACSAAGVAAAVRLSAGARVAWCAWFWVKRVVIALVVCVAGSMLVTMALNPAMTFFDAANALFGGITGLIEKVLG